MIWDKVAPLYDMFETLSNNKVFNGTGRVVAEEISEDDCVLECACGTGMLTSVIAGRCRTVTATDYAPKMLKRAEKNCAGSVRSPLMNTSKWQCVPVARPVAPR